MTWTYAIDPDTNDFIIPVGSGGKLTVANGADEVIQRIKVAMKHYIYEYFTNIADGVPWYEEILGSISNPSKISNILRTKILEVPGVLRLEAFNMDYNSIIREISITGDVVVQSGPDNTDTDFVNLDGITIPVEE